MGSGTPGWKDFSSAGWRRPVINHGVNIQDNSRPGKGYWTLNLPNGWKRFELGSQLF